MHQKARATYVSRGMFLEVSRKVKFASSLRRAGRPQYEQVFLRRKLQAALAWLGAWLRPFVLGGRRSSGFFPVWLG